MTSVLIVDDHELVRIGVRRLLEAADGLEVVGDVGTADDALREARRTRPDVVVLDLSLSGQSGLELVGELRELGARVVILSVIGDAAHAQAALERGAQGYVLKESAASDLVEAIRTVVDDRLYLPQALLPELVHGVRDAGLSIRERELLRLYALGHTNHEIAAQLVLSVRTVESHRRHILEKLRLHTRADLVRYALEHRIIGGDRSAAAVGAEASLARQEHQRRLDPQAHLARVAQLELGEDRVDVVLDAAPRDPEPRRDRAVGVGAGDQREDLALPRGEPGDGLPDRREPPRRAACRPPAGRRAPRPPPPRGWPVRAPAGRRASPSAGTRGPGSRRRTGPRRTAARRAG